jgi:hypothetical protein
MHTLEVGHAPPSLLITQVALRQSAGLLRSFEQSPSMVQFAHWKSGDELWTQAVVCSTDVAQTYPLFPHDTGESAQISAPVGQAPQWPLTHACPTLQQRRPHFGPTVDWHKHSLVTLSVAQTWFGGQQVFPVQLPLGQQGPVTQAFIRPNWQKTWPVLQGAQAPLFLPFFLWHVPEQQLLDFVHGSPGAIQRASAPLATSPTPVAAAAATSARRVVRRSANERRDRVRLSNRAPSMDNPLRNCQSDGNRTSNYGRSSMSGSSNQYTYRRTSWTIDS